MESKKSNAQDIQAKTYLSETQYYEVTRVSGNRINVKNERGFEFGIASNIVEEGMYTADQYAEVVEVNRTQLIEIFSKVGDTIFTVNFNKQPKAKDINDALANINKGKIIANAEIKKVVKEAYKGENRTLIGYLKHTETGFGRSSVIDLEQERGDNPDWDARTRQVDHRTLNWLISKNVKYIVK